MSNEKSECKCFEKQHTQNLSFQLSELQSYTDATNNDFKFWWKDSTAAILASYVLKGKQQRQEGYFS